MSNATDIAQQLISDGKPRQSVIEQVSEITAQLADTVKKGDLFFSVKDYGAKGDGSTDDTASIQSAIDAANAKGGGIVYFLPGTFIFDPNIGIKIYSNIHLLGAPSTLKAKGGTIKNAANAITTNGFVNGAYNASTPIIQNAIIEGLIIDGNDSGTTYPITNFASETEYKIKIVGSSGATGNVVINGSLLNNAAASETLALNGTTPVNGSVNFNTIRNITFPAGSGTVTVSGVNIATSVETVIINTTLSSAKTIENPTLTGINAYKVQNFVVRDCTIKNLPGKIGGGYGFISWYSNKVTLQNVTISNTDRSNIYVWETQDMFMQNVDCSFSYFRDAITIGSNSPISYQGTTYVIDTCKFKNDSSTGTHVVRNAGTVSGTIQNSTIIGNTGMEGIYLVTGANAAITVVNNTITGCSYGILAENSSTGQTFLIDNNKILNCTNGIKLNQTTESASITNNKIKGSTTQPLYVSGVVHATITGNEIDGGSAQVSLFGDVSLVFSHNKVRNLTFASYSVLISSSGSATAIPNVFGNTLTGNTVNEIRILTDARVVGNNATINSSTARSEFLNKYSVTYGTAAPTTMPAGATIGDMIINSVPTRVKNIDHWRVISLSGAGTWYAYGTGWGTTAERPTLAAQDAGYSFFDTTLAKMILWNGTAWLV